MWGSATRFQLRSPSQFAAAGPARGPGNLVSGA
jgi:hypothetical protein